MAFERGLGVDAPSFPDADGGVLATGEDPAIAHGAAAVGEVLAGGRGGQRHHGAGMASVGEVARNV